MEEFPERPLARLDLPVEKVGRDLSGLVYARRLAAKVDTQTLQYGYQLYPHISIHEIMSQYVPLTLLACHVTLRLFSRGTIQ